MRRSCNGSMLFLVMCVWLLGLSAHVSADQITVVLTEVKQDANWNRAVALFTAKTGIKVDVVTMTNWNELRAKLPTLAAAGEAPDAVYHDNGAQGQLIALGLMQPIDRFVAKDHFNLNVWPKPLVDAYRYDGHLYSLPTAVSVFALYYNVDALQAAGYAGLPTDWNAPGFTFDDIEAMAKKLTVDRNGDGTPDQYGLNEFFNRGAQALPLWNLHWISADKTQFLGTQPDVLDAISAVRRLWQEDHVVGGNFLKGSAAILPIQPYYLNTIGPATEKGGVFKWSLGVLPKVVCRCSSTGFQSWGIPAGAKHPDDAWQFIKFITTDPEGAAAFNLAENRVPVLPSVQKAFVERWDQRNPGMHADVLTSGLENVVKMRIFDTMPRDLWNDIYGAMKQVMAGKASPKDAMNGITPAVQAILAHATAH